MVKPLGAEEKAKEPETTGKGRTEDEKKEIFPLETRVENTSKARKVTGFVEFPTFAQEVSFAPRAVHMTFLGRQITSTRHPQPRIPLFCSLVR